MLISPKLFPEKGRPLRRGMTRSGGNCNWREEVNFNFGFSSVHHFSRLRPTSSTFCAAAAARTSRLRLGPMGYTVPLYDPIRLVEEVALLDNITHGRLEVGLTAGTTPEEFRIYGSNWDTRHAETTEAMYLLKKGLHQRKTLRLRRPIPTVQSSSLVRGAATTPPPAALANIADA